MSFSLASESSNDGPSANATELAGEFKCTIDPDDVSDGVTECRALLKLASSIAAAAEKESFKMAAGIADEKEGLSSILLSGANFMGGVDGSSEALESIFCSVQLQNQKLRLHAAELMELSTKMHRVSSEVASMLSDAVNALDESRVSFDSAVYKFLIRKQVTDHPKVLAKRAAYETEIKHVRSVISHAQCICRAFMWRCSSSIARSRLVTDEESKSSQACSRGLSALDTSAAQYENNNAFERPDSCHPTARSSATQFADHSPTGVITLLSRCSPKFIFAIFSSISNLHPSEAFSFHSSLLRVLDDCNRAEEMMCALLTDNTDRTSRAGQPNVRDPFIVASSNSCGVHLSAALHMAGCNALSLLLRPLVQTIASEQAWFEIDPDHTEQDESIEANIGNLERACQWFLDTILVGLKDIPNSCRQLLALVASCFRDQGLKAMCQAASLCYFSQLVIPFITNPLSLHSPPEKQAVISARSSRAFKYIAEALAAVASNAPFDANAGGLSKHMSAVNSFIIRNAPRTLVAFELVTSAPSTPSTPRNSTMPETSCELSEIDDTRLIYSVLSSRRDFLESWLSAQELQDDLALLAELCGPTNNRNSVFPMTSFEQQARLVAVDSSDSDSSDPASGSSCLNHDAVRSTIPSFSDSSFHFNETNTGCREEASATGSSTAAPTPSGTCENTNMKLHIHASNHDEVSDECRSLSPVSLLVQSHTGVLPPPSPSSPLKSRSATNKYALEAGRSTFSKGVAAFSGNGDSHSIPQQNGTDELEDLLQHQIMSDYQTKGHLQQINASPQRQQRVSELQLKKPLVQDTVLRLPLTPPQLLSILPECGESLVGVIRPQATRILPAAAGASSEGAMQQHLHQQHLISSLSADSSEISSTKSLSVSSSARDSPKMLTYPKVVSSGRLGVSLKRNSHGMLCIRRVRSNSSCYGKVETGDVLIAVDDVDASVLSVSQVYQMLLNPSGHTLAFRLRRVSRSDPSQQADIDIIIDKQASRDTAYSRGDSWDDHSSVSSGSSLASMCSEDVEADVSGSDSSNVQLQPHIAAQSFPSVSCGIGMFLRRNKFGQYFIRGLSGASKSCGVFNVGDQLVALDGISVDGASSKNIIRKMNGTTGSAVNVTVKTCSQGMFSYSCYDSDHVVGETFKTVVIRSNATALSESTVYIGVGLVVKRAVEPPPGLGAVCYILFVRDCSPAAAAGLSVGDVLVSVDGINVKSRSSNAIVLLLQGPAHAEVELLIHRSCNSSAQDGNALPHAEQFKVRVQRRPLSAPDICLDFSSNNPSSSRAAQVAAAAAGRSAVAVATSGSNSVYSAATPQFRRVASPNMQHGVGFGMNLKRDATGAFFVRRLDAGGPSALCGRISVGDECLTIDGVALKGKSYSALSRLVVGAPCSTVELVLRRPNAGVIKKVLINRRSHAPSIPEDSGEGERSSSRGTPDVSSPKSEERVGIGATFCKGRNGLFEVEQLELGGAAEISGIHVGDVVVEVDGVSVVGASAEWFTDSILGSPGSSVTLKFQRRSRGRTGPGMIENVVVLARGGAT